MASREKPEDPPVDTLHKLECMACPLNGQPHLRHPKMAPTGSKRPVIYVIGEGPGAEEDFKGQQFIGRSGQLLRRNIPDDWIDSIRFNNVVRTRPPGNKRPDWISIECCRPSVAGDIAKARPQAIFGFGATPLDWVIGPGWQIGSWRGRRFPVNVAGHHCWYYAFHHPAYILRVKDSWFGEQEYKTFKFDLVRAFEEVSGLEEPPFHSRDEAFKNLESVLGQSADDLDLILKHLRWASTRSSGLDYETNGLRPFRTNQAIQTIAVGDGERTVAFPLHHPGAAWGAKALKKLKDGFRDFLLQCPEVIAHNAAFEMEWTLVSLFDEGNQVEAARDISWRDTQSAAYSLDERKFGHSLSLSFNTVLHHGIDIKALSDVNTKKIMEEPLETVLPYNALDAKYAQLIHIPQVSQLEQLGLTSVYERQLRRLPTVVLTQIKGVPVDQTVVQRLQKKYERRIVKFDSQIQALPVVKQFVLDEPAVKKGDTFNPASVQQLLYVFKEMLHRPEVEKYDKKKHMKVYSVDEEVLAKIKHPLAKLVVGRRKASRQKSTYIDPLAVGSDFLYDDGRFHSNLHTTFTTTGRLSSSNPNQQNFPHRDGEAVEVRGQVVAPFGYTLVAVDYGQIEARVIAMASEDQRLVDALWKRYDVHKDWAQRIAKVYPRRVKHQLDNPDIMKAFRTDIKNQWTFPLFFGASLQSASGYLNIPEHVLKPLYGEFWSEFPGVLKWQKKVTQFYDKHGYVETLTGRRRRAPITVNELINSPIQGTAADIVIDAMDRLSEDGDWHLQPILNIHDDLTFLFPDAELKKYVRKTIGVMVKPQFDFINVPITVEGSVGVDWAVLEPFGTFASDEWFAD